MSSAAAPASIPTLTWDDQLHPLWCKALERLARSETDPQELIQVVITICHNVRDEADPSIRISELERVRYVTLDADSDVWSVSEQGSLISLTGRIAELTALLP